MDEEKKSEASREEPERLGPYQIQEQVSQSRDGQGGFYVARNETSGAPALVYKSDVDEGAVPRKDWRVSLISSASAGYMALEAEETPYAVAPDRQSAESLVSTLEEVGREVRHLTQALPQLEEPRPSGRLGGRLAGAVAACALLFVLVRLVPGSQRPGDPEPEASAESASRSHDAPSESETLDLRTSAWLGDTAPQGDLVVARPLPRQPFKGQKRPPCTRLVEVELIGACWGPHELKAPCPDELFEHQGKCYAPIFSARPPPQSVGQ